MRLIGYWNNRDQRASTIISTHNACHMIPFISIIEARFLISDRILQNILCAEYPICDGAQQLILRLS